MPMSNLPQTFVSHDFSSFAAALHERRLSLDPIQMRSDDTSTLEDQRFAVSLPKPSVSPVQITCSSR